MLKVYNYYAYVSIDGSDWRMIDRAYHIGDDNPSDLLVLDNATFDEVREYLNNNPVFGMHNNCTLFGRKPTIEIGFDDEIFPVKYRYFNTLSYKIVYKEWKDVPLKWLMEHTSAEQFIQYLKERGITTCPIMK